MSSLPKNWDHCLDVACISDVGMRRANNQDAYAIAMASDQAGWEKQGHLFLVADGMGAHAAGEMASKMAADNIPLGYHKYGHLPVPEAFRKSVQDANELIHRRGLSSDDFRGMGTTATAMLILPNGAVVAQVGDSRAYRLRGNLFEQLTFDHSLVWEMRAAGQIADEQIQTYIPKNIITRSLGPNADVQVDLEGPFPIEVGDTFLICSDGLSGQVSDKEMGAILTCLPPKKAVRALVDLANLRGGPDNVTIIVVRVTAPLSSKQTQEPDPPTVDMQKGAPSPISPWVFVSFFVLLVAALLAGVLGHVAVAIGCGVGALVAGIIGLAQRGSGTKIEERRSIERPLGRGPYVRVESTPDREVVSWLADVVSQLRQAVLESNWTVEWKPFDRQVQLATAGRNAGNFVQSVTAYCEAVCYMMQELRRQGHRTPTSTSVLS